jgi:hypothetical protein
VNPAATVVDVQRLGYLGLHWSAEKATATRRWSVVGRTPGRPHSLGVVMEVKFRPGHTSATEIARVTACALNQISGDLA